MPSRKRYRITVDGDLLFKQASKKLLENNEFYYFDLTLALACRHFLDQEEFHRAVRSRLDKLYSFLDNFKDKFENSKELYPEKRHLIREYLLSHYELERAFLESLLKETSDEIK